ncbi:hypothetical protein MTO96_035129 [Rhipicephalus appendiculatus]
MSEQDSPQPALLVSPTLRPSGVPEVYRPELLVGAPDAQTPQPNVDRGGAVFRCSTEASGSCQPVPFDQSGR